MMKISICDKCKGFNHLNLIKRLKEVYPTAEYRVGCNNMCGIGRDNIVIILNDKPIIASNIDELIYKIEQANII